MHCLQRLLLAFFAVAELSPSAAELDAAALLSRFGDEDVGLLYAVLEVLSVLALVFVLDGDGG